jgi:hypothetical protein
MRSSHVMALAATLALACGGVQAAPAAAAGSPAPAVTYILEQLQTGPLPPGVQRQLPPLHTLKDVEDLLKANYIAFNWRRVDVASTQLNPELARQIAALPPGEVFIVPTTRGVSMNVIVGRR